MKFATCSGATSGLNLIRISPLFVTMRAKYDFAGSNLGAVGSFSFVRHAGSFLSMPSLAIWASMALTAASTDAGLDLPGALAVAAFFAVSAGVEAAGWPWACAMPAERAAAQMRFTTAETRA